MEIREAAENDLEALLNLYTQLHDNPMPEINEALVTLWKRILNDINHHIVIGIINGVIVSACVLIVVPNLTHHQRPYALIENVITDEKHRGQGHATAVLNHARDIAARESSYKIMLMTGSKRDSTLRFYERAGYNRHDKTAFVQWL
jgi:GNAT superfamily N-acetyltransferase